MTLIKTVNEGGQWIAILTLLTLLFSFDFDFFDSAPKRVIALESKQEQQGALIQSMEERLSQVESDLEGLKNTQSAGNLQEQINTLRSDIKNLASVETTPNFSQSEITPIEAIKPKITESKAAQPWYQQRYLWVGSALVLVAVILILMWVAKRRKKKVLSVVRGPWHKNGTAASNNRDCA
ncbi:hypothetical protein MSNKSG1_10573 [Marinobacter santoriniensis NKSG1]|uniref:Uncharacterized protein n=1 Tax=Marinobacter santoriniensis NKSG1 TaxID=1288826 RepID=M7DF63_9GAMM|nr:hypothetical protein [Marinobacter santoriniensis]EMP56312.1 hypothetical protein MSNKSG1_10573 [Marinobacter santoriniensis NKSG1]